MSGRKKTHFAILGLLSWQPMSGYDIKKMVEIGISHFWNENYGNLYPTLDQLVQDGFATKTEDASSGKRKRYVYEITPEGQNEFMRWVQEPTSAPVVRNEMQLKFFLASRLPTRINLKNIQSYQAQQLQQLAEYRSSETILRAALEEKEFPKEIEPLLNAGHVRLSRKQKHRQLKVLLLSLRHGILAIEARIQWCKEVIEVLPD